ncbi:DUF916 domain-containing protein [Streptomyces sp. NPDC093595]|uniref:DUF916 domain-containing protein n=1 Tax=Streptomyces sp. NPDC093595 TaxID=3366045 RepID=UPI00381624D6
MTEGESAPVPRPLYAILPLLLAALLALLPATPARAAENGEWAVYLSAGPGTTLTDRVTVANKTAAPLTFRLYAADAYNTERDGGFAVRSPDEPRRGVGAWAVPDRERVTVPAHGEVTVPYTLTVPPDAEPGDHAGALVALDERVERATARGGAAVGVRRAVGARIHLRVTGPTVPALAVEDVTWSADAPLVPGTGESTALISYTLHNTGNVTLSPRAALRAEGLFGRTLLTRELRGVPSELLPRQRIRLTARWAGAPLLEWGEVTVTATARDVRASGGASFLALPWLVVLVAAAVLMAAAGALLRLRYVRRLAIGENGPHERS